jgi:multicomponent Na+:H+ antiporter subunit E
VTATSAAGRAHARRGRAPVGLVVSLVALWLLLWGDLSVANVASGVLVALGLLAVFPLARPAGGTHHLVRPVALVRLVGYIAFELVISNLVVTRVILSPRPRTRTGVVACPLRTTSDRMVTVLCNLIALSPGTMMVDVSDDTLYVHALLLRDLDKVRQDVDRLQRLLLAAFPPVGPAERGAP